MPLSPENQALFDRVWRESLGPGATFTDALGRLIEAARSEERAKAEGEVEEARAEAAEKDASADTWLHEHKLSEARATQAEELGETMRSLADELDRAATDRQAWADHPDIGGNKPPFANHLRGKRYGYSHAAQLIRAALSAKLKAAPLQGGEA